MCNYDQDFLNQIRDNVNLFEYVQSSTDWVFTKRGNDYFTSCPLHVDLTPSLSFTPLKNQYYCFSCSSGGSIFRYLVDYEHLTFDKAVEKAAKLADMDLSKMCNSPTISYLKQLRNLKMQKKIEPHKIIPEIELDKYRIEPVKEWLDEGISQKWLDCFDVRIDNISNRIVYPVRDIDGNLINIKGRTRLKDYKILRIPKYINYFQVGELDYLQGLYNTKEFVKEKKEIIIFESIKSCMKVCEWGYKNTASAEKHSLTDTQIILLIKLGVDIVLAYDSDVSYNQKEIQKNINILKRFTNVYLINNKDIGLGGADTKNSPADCGKDIWDRLYNTKKKVR